MNRLFLAGCFLLCFALAASAQESVRIGEPFTLAAAHDGLLTTLYQVELLVPGAPTPIVTETRPVSELANGEIRFAYPAGFPATSPVGTYQVQVVAVGPEGTTRSPILEIILSPASGPGPVPPGLPRIIR